MDNLLLTIVHKLHCGITATPCRIHHHPQTINIHGRGCNRICPTAILAIRFDVQAADMQMIAVCVYQSKRIPVRYSHEGWYDHRRCVRFKP